ncbi:hypothetical protein [Bacillus phage SWEP1]|nr:hypothetical protein [Bacillus phage SWEP1]
MKKIVNSLYSIGFTLIGIGTFMQGNEVAGAICLVGAMYAFNKAWEAGGSL